MRKPVCRINRTSARICTARFSPRPEGCWSQASKISSISSSVNGITCFSSTLGGLMPSAGLLDVSLAAAQNRKNDFNSSSFFFAERFEFFAGAAKRQEFVGGQVVQ